MAPTRRRILASLALGAAGQSWADRPRAQRESASRAAARNVVLVHGAFADGSSWSEVITRLQAAGYKVTAVQNPLTSLADDVASTRRVLERQDGPVILVGHSWGGAVITAAGVASNVVALVYVSALAPDAGESAADLQQHGPPSTGMRGARPDTSGALWFDPAAYADALAADVPVERVGVLAAVQQPIAAASFAEKLTVAAWHDKPSWFLLSENDKALSPQLQRWMARRMGAATVAVPSSHMSLISHAAAVVSLIEKAAHVR
jgi:pimeloyl-ACP methyl ester carboxylesterase